MTNEERQDMRAAVAAENGVALYRQYGEREAAHFLKVDVTTLKRWRRAGKVAYVKHGDGVRYLGLMIVDFLIAGTDSVKWHDIANENSQSAITGSDNEAAPRPGIDAGLRGLAPSALALAQTTLKKPSAS